MDSGTCLQSVHGQAAAHAPPSRRHSRCAALLTALALLAPATYARAASPAGGEIYDLPFEDLMRMEVTAPSRFQQPVMESQNAVWVIGGDAIRRSGARSVPEALALAPGVYVAQTSGNRWTVSIGGLSLGAFSNKLLVLLDNVTVYNTLFGYVDWDLVPVTIDEIDRIEVIRGAAGVQYGANAVSGVIAIFTREAGLANPSAVSLAGGSQGLRSAHAAAGVASEGGAFRARIAAGYDEDNGLGGDGGDEVRDSQRLATGSLRMSYRPGGALSWSLDGRWRGGELLYPASGVIPEQRREPSSGMLRLRLDRAPATGGESYLQLFLLENTVDLEERDERSTYEDSTTADVEFQHRLRFTAAGRHALVVGGGYRAVDIEHEILEGGANDFTVANLFVSEEWRPVESLLVSGGVKWERFSESDPTWPWRVALLWLPNPDHSLRAGFSTAYRAPTQLEQHQRILIAGGFVRLLGNPDLDAEHTETWEAGYRGRLWRQAYLDLSWARRRSSDLIVQEKYRARDGGTEYLYRNGTEATTDSLEAGLDVRLGERASCAVALGHLSTDLEGAAAREQYPEQPEYFGSAALRLNLPAGFAADGMLRYSSAVDARGIDEVWRLDARLAKVFRLAGSTLEAGVVGQNLLDAGHVEAEKGAVIPRSWYAYVEASF